MEEVGLWPAYLTCTGTKGVPFIEFPSCLCILPIEDEVTVNYVYTQSMAGRNCETTRNLHLIRYPRVSLAILRSKLFE